MKPTEEALSKLLESSLEPLLRADGGEVYAVTLNEELVALHLSGSHAGCPGNNLLRRRIIEPLVARVAPKARVEVTSGPCLPPGARRLGPLPA